MYCISFEIGFLAIYRIVLGLNIPYMANKLSFNKMSLKLKVNETIGCCGIDCGLCPRYNTEADSACPGCGGLNFRAKHPSCGFLTCCVIRNGFDVCSECKDYPCNRFDSEKNGYDSFVTHRKVFENLNTIKKSGIDSFLDQQKERMGILNILLTNYDDGRSKSFFCLSCTLFPLVNLHEILHFAKRLNQDFELKDKNKQIKNYIFKIGDVLNIDLKLNIKSKAQ